MNNATIYFELFFTMFSCIMHYVVCSIRNKHGLPILQKHKIAPFQEQCSMGKCELHADHCLQEHVSTVAYGSHFKCDSYSNHAHEQASVVGSESHSDRFQGQCPMVELKNIDRFQGQCPMVEQKYIDRFQGHRPMITHNLNYTVEQCSSLTFKKCIHTCFLLLISNISVLLQFF